MKTPHPTASAVIKATVERRPAPSAPKFDFVYPIPEEPSHTRPEKDEEPGRYDLTPP